MRKKERTVKKKKYKHMEIKQYVSKSPISYWRNQKVNKKNLETNDN